MRQAWDMPRVGACRMTWQMSSVAFWTRAKEDWRRSIGAVALVEVYRGWGAVRWRDERGRMVWISMVREVQQKGGVEDVGPVTVANVSRRVSGLRPS